MSELLEAARAATLNDRIDLRDEIAGHGTDAIEAMTEWLGDPVLSLFAIRVMGRASEMGARQHAVDALRKAGANALPAHRQAIDAELKRIGAPAVVRSGAYGPIDDAAIRDRLIAAARRREVVHYADLAKATGREMKGPNWAAHIGRILGRISSAEARAGRPLLSVIVVSRDSGRPGGGFLTLGQELHLLEPGEDEDSFVRRQTERVYDYWSVNP